jgi:hypothetical protein
MPDVSNVVGDVFGNDETVATATARGAGVAAV